MEKHMRQGDVLLVRVGSVPAKAKRLATNIVAYGEVTGHAHKVEVDAGDCVLTEDEEGNMFVSVKGKAALKHDEHAPLPLAEGHYKVVKQREYEPDKIRNVAD
jgi:hypothetical protein